MLGANGCGIDRLVCGFVKPSTKSTAQAGLPIPLAGSPNLILLGHAGCQDRERRKISSTRVADLVVEVERRERARGAERWLWAGLVRAA